MVPGCTDYYKPPVKLLQFFFLQFFFFHSHRTQAVVSPVLTVSPSGCFAGSKAWIGYNDGQSEGTWVWPDLTSATYTNWNVPREPNNAWGNEDCAEMRLNSPRGTWNDARCSNTNPFFCTAAGGIGADGDPHLSLPHGGKADFRGEHKVRRAHCRRAHVALPRALSCM